MGREGVREVADVGQELGLEPGQDKRRDGVVTANRWYGVSFWGDKNVLEFQVMIAQLLNTSKLYTFKR